MTVQNGGAMSPGLVYEVYREQALGMKRAVEHWRLEHLDALATWDVERIVRALLQLPPALREAWNKTFERLFVGGEPLGPEQARSSMAGALEAVLEALVAYRDLAMESERQTGRNIEGLANFHAAIREVGELNDQLREHWPAFGPRELAEAHTAVRNGEGTELLDAFAGAAGVDRDTMLQRLERHRRKRHPEDTGAR